MTSVVTALYDIGRENLTGKNAYRKFSKYLDWFKNLLLINVPMIIFVPKYLRGYVLEHRSESYPTTLIIREFDELKAYKYRERIREALDKMKRNIPTPKYFDECPEFLTPDYQVVTYSKLDLLKEVAESNPHNTTYIIWLDAGIFHQVPPFNYELAWPDPYKIRTLGDKFLVCNRFLDVQDTSPLQDPESYLRLNRNEIWGHSLGGTREAIEFCHQSFWGWVDRGLELGVTNNDQHILQLCVLGNPSRYKIWERTSSKYPRLKWPIIDRMVPAELSLGAPLPHPYELNPHIKLLTVATKEISIIALEKWETTARHYGYNYEILGRDVEWKGFGTKIKVYHEGLRKVTQPYSALTDCTDLFFSGCSDELYDKFISLGAEVVVGGEPGYWYKHGRHKGDEVVPFFKRLAMGKKNLYPNSGLLIGKTSTLVKLTGIYYDHGDDQGMCYDAIYEGKIPITIDYDEVLVANCKGKRRDVTWEPEIGRYTTKTSTPTIIHFPGKNLATMNEFYEKSQSSLSGETYPTSYIFLTVVIVLSFVALLVVIGSRASR